MSLPFKKKVSPSQNIKVVVRVRPFSDDENAKGMKNIVQCVSSKEIYTKDKQYQFDKVFPPDSSQLDIYSYVVSPMITDVIAGYNCTVFAYGQTGTGKTHTMIGGDHCSSVNWKEDEQAGCIPRAAAHIFDEIASMDNIQYSVNVSFLELYNEEVRDLLNEDEHSPSLNIFNDTKGSVYIHGLKEISVRGSSDIYALLLKGTSKRQTACTLINNHSSRSHTVFTITVHIRESIITGEEVLKTGKINLVDLAGSENIAKSGAKDKRAVELANINKSLLTLGRVIQILTEKNNKHIPYRDSKLTRILQDSLGGHTKTCIIATISPCLNSYDETANTLEYACRVRDIKNTPRINEKVSKARMIKAVTDEINNLKRDLEAARSGKGFYIDKENWEQFNFERENATNVVAFKNQVIEVLKNRFSEYESECALKAAEFDQIMRECHKRRKIIDKAKKLLKEKTKDLKQKEYVSDFYAKVATEKAVQVNDLMRTTQNLSENQTTLLHKLEKQYFNNYSNEQLVKQKTENLTTYLKEIEEEEHLLNSSLSGVANILRELHHLQEIAKEAVSQKMCWETDIMPSMLLNLEEHQNISKKIIEQPSFLIQRVESNVEKLLSSIGAINSGSNKLLEQLNTCEKKELNKSESMAQQLETLKLCLLQERDQRLSELQELKIVTDITQNRIIDIDAHLNNIDCNVMEQTLSNVSQFKQDIFKFQENSSALEEGLTCLKLELGNNKECLNELQQQMLPKLQYLKQEVIERFDGLKGLLTELSDNINSIIPSISINCRVQEEAIAGHVEKVSIVLGICDEIVTTDILKNIIPAQRAGDTPKQYPIEYPKAMSKGALPREALIHKFMDEFDEDIENHSFHLNCSTDSLSNF